MADGPSDDEITKDLRIRKPTQDRLSPIPRAAGVSGTTLDAFTVLAKRIESAQGAEETTQQCLKTVYDIGVRSGDVERAEAQSTLARSDADLALARVQIASLHAEVRRWKARYERAIATAASQAISARRT